jgi:vacuolar-type H+-ATPase subunit E/Vma4
MFKQSSMGKEADDFKRHLEWRKLANQVAGDPAIVAAKAAAEAAKTDLEKRERLRTYYNLYYERIAVLASTPELKAYINAKKKAHLAVLAQPRVRPTPITGKSPGG